MSKELKTILILLIILVVVSAIFVMKLFMSKGEGIQQKQQSTYTEEIGTKNEKNNSIGKLYDITEKISLKNNIFEYNDLYIDEYDEDLKCIIVYIESMKNITSTIQKPNIKIKFYDSNKELILDYQHRRENPDTDNTRSIEKGEEISISFTIYDGKTHFLDFEKTSNNGRTLKDAKYFSIENIESIE